LEQQQNKPSEKGDPTANNLIIDLILLIIIKDKRNYSRRI